MNLGPEDIDYIKQHLGGWLTEASLGKPPAVYEIELRERMIRVEEELKHQRELMQQGFGLSEKRLEAMQESMDKRFEAMQESMDKRFETMQESMNKRFETMQESMNKRFEQVDKRFEQVDKRFEQVDKRFEQVDKRFEELTRRMDRFMFWSFTITVSVGAAVIAALRFWK